MFSIAFLIGSFSNMVVFREVLFHEDCYIFHFSEERVANSTCSWVFTKATNDTKTAFSI
ncbi:hypothetical protein J19TS1_50500 [Heyndrickxia oleronia]|nr:hypothetical protein J19TS1_50500 [Heyndrickxia oleronia]